MPQDSSKSQPFVPILDELLAKERLAHATQRLQSKPWGGRRAGAGAPRGNLNAFKHGKTSRRQQQIIDALVDIPEVRDALVAIANRQRRRRKQAELTAAFLLTEYLQRPDLHPQEINQDEAQSPDTE
jgi:hypothetical protein